MRRKTKRICKNCGGLSHRMFCEAPDCQEVKRKRANKMAKERKREELEEDARLVAEFKKPRKRTLEDIQGMTPEQIERHWSDIVSSRRE